MTTSASPTSASEGEIRHKTLSAYFDHVKTIASYFPNAPLARPGDPQAYIALISGAVCAYNASSRRPPAVQAGVVDGTQQEIIDRVLDELSRTSRSKDSRNVLLSKDKYNTDMPINMARPGVENRLVDCPATIIRSTPWKILRSRIGDAAFRHLLVHTAIFLPVGNNCYLQLTGTPMYYLYDERTRLEGKALQLKRKRSTKFMDGKGRKRCKGEAVAVEARPAARKCRGDSPADVIIARQMMFYGRPTYRREGSIVHGLPPQHVLNTVTACRSGSPSDAACLRLMHIVFPRSMPNVMDHVVGIRPARPPNPLRTAKMIGAMRGLLSQHYRVPYTRLLKQCIDRSRDMTHDGLQVVSQSQVCRYIVSVLRQAIGTTLMGTEHNVQVLCRHAKSLVQAKQFEPITLHSLLEGIRISDIPWLASDMPRPTAGESSKRREILEEWILWLFNEYLMPLLKNNFYITETSLTRYETVYYSHEEWLAATKPHFKHLQAEHLEPLDQEETTAALRGPLGAAAVRLIPKPNGFRPIVNLGRRLGASSMPGILSKDAKAHSSANHILTAVHQVLSYERDRHRDFLGSSLFGTNEIFAPIQALRQDLIDIHGKIPRLYFVKMDIRAAFDTIKQDKMLAVITSLLDETDDYCLLLFCLLLPPASNASQSATRKFYKKRAVINDGMMSGFGDLVPALAKPLRNAVIVDMVRKKTITRQHCLDLLRAHIKNNIWRIDNQCFRQREGIPQGSKISSLLCSIFYAALEREHLASFTTAGSRLLRYIDDFMYITDDAEAAGRYMGTMSRGFPSYGALISPHKTLVSFPGTSGDVVPYCAPNSQGSIHFPYCGFLIDCQTLELSMDIPRMTAGDVSQSFALRFARHRGAAFVGWLSRQLENRNHVAYLDTAHNSLERAHLNIYLNFATTTMKIPHYFLNSEDITPKMATLVYGSIVESIGYTFAAGRARVLHAARESVDRKQHYKVKRIDFEFLAKVAVCRIFTKKASRFKSVVHLLRVDLGKSANRGLWDRHADVLAKGWKEIQHTRF